MKFVLDTSAYSEFNRGNKSLREWFDSENEIIVPLPVVGELRAGFVAGSKQSENESLLQRFLDSPNVTTASITDATTKLFAEIYLSLRQKGKAIGVNDIWIASITLEYDTILLTLDGVFSYIPDLIIADI